MLNDIVVVESAISAFNNAALAAPAFLWWMLLALPLFVVVRMCSDFIMTKLGWDKSNILEHVSVWTAGLTLMWVVLFGGNYGVLRDSLSVLSPMVAVIVFLTSLFVSSHLRNVPLPQMKRSRWIMLGVIVCVVLGLSDMHAWWGPLLQIGAFALGVVLGRIAKAEMRPVAGLVLIMMTVVVAMLMQPEFFRFGQLGNLTVVHKLAVMAMGVLAMAIVAIMNVNPRNKIRQSAFVKLKWLMRVICALAGALFILTEAVPVFLGMMAAVFVAFALSVWHTSEINRALGDKMLALLMAGFGVITVMPAVTAMAILYWHSVKSVDFWQESKPLL